MKNKLPAIIELVFLTFVLVLFTLIIVNLIPYL